MNTPGPIRAPVVFNQATGIVRLGEVVVGAKPVTEWITAVHAQSVAAHESVGFSHPERPPAAWLQGPTGDRACDLGVDGASAGLALALGSLGQFEGRPALGATVATGCVQNGNVLWVGHLKTKIQRSAEILSGAGGGIVLFPAANLGDQGVEGELARLRTGHPSVQFQSVSTLAEAMRQCFELPTEWPYETFRVPLRKERFDDSRAAQLYNTARALHRIARTLPADSLRRRHLTVEAADYACFALRKLRGQRVPSWDADDGLVVTAEHASEGVERELSYLDSHDALEMEEMIATLRNLRATDGFKTLRFSQSIDVASDALCIHGVRARRDDPDTEYRKLLGTRAQFYTREGLRRFALGEPDSAAHHVSRAVRDAEEALALARDGGGRVEMNNDRARVELYLAAARFAQELTQTGGPSTSNDAEERDELQRLLGGLATGTDEWPCPQDPRWALELVYARWGSRGQAPRIVDHLKSTWETSVRVPGNAAPVSVWNLLAREEGGALACDWPLLARAREAALQSGDDPELVKRLEGLMLLGFPRDGLVPIDSLLLALTFCENDLGACRARLLNDLNAYRSDPMRLPAALRGSRWVSQRLEEIGTHRGGPRSAVARAELLLFAGRFTRPPEAI